MNFTTAPTMLDSTLLQRLLSLLSVLPFLSGQLDRHRCNQGYVSKLSGFFIDILHCNLAESEQAN